MGPWVKGVLLFVAGVAVAVTFWAVGRNTAPQSTVTVGAAPSAGTATTPAPASNPTTKINPEVAAGGHLYVSFACVQCHGPDGKGGVSPDVPALKSASKLTPAQLRVILDHGLGVVSDPKKPYMPVWGPILSEGEIAALVSYIRAGLPPVPTAEPLPVPTGQGAAQAGAVLYVNYGCINCHGANGVGGVPNPESPDKTIPPLSGQDFRKEFNTDAKIISIIRSGSVIGRAPIVSMPHWGGILSERQLRDLTAYLKTLK